VTFIFTIYCDLQVHLDTQDNLDKWAIQECQGLKDQEEIEVPRVSAFYANSQQLVGCGLSKLVVCYILENKLLAAIVLKQFMDLAFTQLI